MKKIAVLFMSLCLIFVFSACGSNNEETSSGTPVVGISEGDMTIEDFEWDVDEAKIEGYDCYALSLTNNSKYDLLGIQIEYTPKEGATDDQLSSFEVFLDEHSDYVDEGQTVADCMLRGFGEEYVAAGSASTDVPLFIGINDYTWSDIPDDEQFNLMEPTELMVGVIGKDNKLYLAYYDIPDGKWKIDSQTVKINNWPDMEVMKTIPKPDAPVFQSDIYENINAVDIDVYGVSEDDFSAYVDQLKEAGFTDVSFDDESYFSSKDGEGNYVSIEFNKYTNSYKISLSGSSKQ